MNPQEPAAPVALPAQPVLEYQRQLKVWTRGGRGLQWLSIAIAVLCAIPTIPSLVMLSGSRPTFDELKYVPLIMLPSAWSITYMAMAILFRRRIRWAGWVAFAMTVFKFLAWTLMAVIAVYNIFQESYGDVWFLKYLATFMFLAVSVGLAAVAVEILLAMRARLAWIAPPDQ